MPRLILIKHAPPEVDPAVPSAQWKLSEQGRQLAGALARRLAAYAPGVVVSSEEPKAIETAQIVAAELNLPAPEAAPDLHEHDRSNVPHLRTGEFVSLVEVFFRKPDQLVLGRETAHAAASRFRSAVDEVLHAHPDRTVAIVSHGTVISLFLAHHTARSGYELWRKMGLPSFAVLHLPGMQLEALVEKVS